MPASLHRQEWRAAMDALRRFDGQPIFARAKAGEFRPYPDHRCRPQLVSVEICRCSGRTVLDDIPCASEISWRIAAPHQLGLDNLARELRNGFSVGDGFQLRQRQSHQPKAKRIHRRVLI